MEAMVKEGEEPMGTNRDGDFMDVNWKKMVISWDLITLNADLMI